METLFNIFICFMSILAIIVLSLLMVVCFYAIRDAVTDDRLKCKLCKYKKQCSENSKKNRANA